VVQDTFIKKGDFEITDVEIMRDHYECLVGAFSDLAPGEENMSSSLLEPKEPFVDARVN
jgi:hypothetical protein